MARYVYVLVSGEQDRYATLALLSAISVRGVDRSSRISVLTDDATAARLRSLHHPLLQSIDDLLPAPIDGAQRLASRFLKTTMLQRVQEDFIYLDTDTLVIRPIHHKLDESHCLQLALDRFPGHPQPGFPDWVIPYFQRLGWRYPTAHYFNTGVMVVHCAAETGRLFEEWHKRWQDYQTQIGKMNDQPPFNSAIDALGVTAGILPPQYNAMIRVKESYRWRARVLHFFAQKFEIDAGTEYLKLVQRVEAGDVPTCDDIRAAMARRVPLLEPWSIHRNLQTGNLLGAWRLMRQPRQG